MSGIKWQDLFIIVGVCETCGNLLGHLKATGGSYNMTYHKETMRDPVVYHVASTITRTRMRCG